MNVTRRAVNDWQVLKLDGRFVVKTLMDVRKEIDAIEAEGNLHKVAFDMTDTNYLDSSALTVMINLINRLKPNDGTFVICNPNKDVAEVLSIVGFDHMAKILPSVDSL